MPPPAELDMRFEVLWLGARGFPITPAHFSRLNASAASRGGRGRVLVMPTTLQQKNVEARGNVLGHYYPNLNQVRKSEPVWPVVGAREMAERVLASHNPQGFNTGWIFLNEMSSALWPAQKGYREWLIEVMARVADRGYTPVVFSPFPKPLARYKDHWKALSEHACIAVENYLNGRAITDQGANAAAFCEKRYGETKTAYTGFGIPESRIFLTEHFGHTRMVENVRRGRCDVAIADWIRAIEVRSAAAHRVGFGGFVSFAWMYNQMKAPEAEILRATETYVAQQLP